MNLILDTHLLIWAASDSLRLPVSVKTILDDRRDVLVFSVASLWEIAIKRTLGRADFQVDLHLLRRGLLDNGYTELSVTAPHALAVLALPPIHKDPFDRLLVAQATAEGMVLVTADPIVARYPGPIRMV